MRWGLRMLAFSSLALAILGAGPARAAPVSVRIGSAPRHPPGSRVLGALDGRARIQVTIALQPRDPVALAAYAAAVSAPGSAELRKYLSVAEFARRFGASAASVAAVRASLRAHGLRPGAPSANGLALSVSADAAAVARGFSTSFHRIALRGGATAYTNANAPRVDGSVAGDIQAIVGLDSLLRFRPLGLQRRSAPRASGVTPHVVTGGPVPCPTATNAASGGYTADQIAAAYDFTGLYGAGDLGAGQTVGLYELESNLTGDISAYQTCYQTSASVSYTKVDGGAGSGAGSGEAALDIEDVIGLAPAANLRVYQGPNTDVGALDTYQMMVTDDQAKVISTSWGVCESNLAPSDAAAEHTLFAEAAIQGQTVVAASGDSGAQDCSTSQSAATTPSVDDPGSQPFVTSVGGTTLTSLGPPPVESIWNNSLGAGGGGNSALWPMPAYQSAAAPSLGVITSSSAPASSCGGTSGFCRQVPDVSADADPFTGYVVYWRGNGQPDDSAAWSPTGGTSASAPTWGAMIALANASGACAGRPIGFANPALYQAAATDYSGDFNDITAGNNDWTATNSGAFAARVGYDQASGLGTPIAPALATTLCADIVSVANPGAQSTLGGTAASVQLRATASSGRTLSFAATGLPRGLSIDAQTGLISGKPTTPGTGPVTAVATDAGGTTGSMTFSWTIRAATINLTTPPNQRGRLQRTATLQLRGSDNNGAGISYSARGLPRGLKLTGSTGRITGRPSAAGNSSVTVTATATGATPASVSFKWAVIGPPTVSRASLSVDAAGKASLRFRVTAGIDAPALDTISLKLPSGFGFVRSAVSRRQGLAVTDAGGRRLRFTASLARGRLTLTLGAGDARPQVAITAPAIQVSRAVTRRIHSHTAGRVTLSVSARDTARLVTSLNVRLRPA
jgi:hypothetical protein